MPRYLILELREVLGDSFASFPDFFVSQICFGVMSRGRHLLTAESFQKRPSKGKGRGGYSD